MYTKKGVLVLVFRGRVYYIVLLQNVQKKETLYCSSEEGLLYRIVTKCTNKRDLVLVIRGRVVYYIVLLQNVQKRRLSSGI